MGNGEQTAQTDAPSASAEHENAAAEPGAPRAEQAAPSGQVDAASREADAASREADAASGAADAASREADAATAEPDARKPGDAPAAQDPAADGGDVIDVEGPEDGAAVEELDPETRARRDAALRLVRKFGDPVLRATALPVERFDEQLQAEAARMGELMHDALGVGLAATQVGILHRLLVYKAYEDDPLTVLVNPEIEWVSEELEIASEGCLSLPAVHVEVERPARVRVRARDEHGEPLEVAAEGLRARVIQHEIDHLDGVLILDRISRGARKEAMRAMREAQEGVSGA